jgi:hypothetical protein
VVLIAFLSFVRILKVRMLNDKAMMLEKGFISDTHVFGLQQTRSADRSLYKYKAINYEPAVWQD